MPATYVVLSHEEAAAAIADALAALRSPRDHLRFLIREALRERGRLPPEVPPTKAAQTAPEATTAEELRDAN